MFLFYKLLGSDTENVWKHPTENQVCQFEIHLKKDVNTGQM